MIYIVYSGNLFNMLYKVIGTGILGWLLNIVLVLCSGPLYVHPTFFTSQCLFSNYTPCQCELTRSIGIRCSRGMPIGFEMLTLSVLNICDRLWPCVWERPGHFFSGLVAYIYGIFCVLIAHDGFGSESPLSVSQLLSSAKRVCRRTRGQCLPSVATTVRRCLRVYTRPSGSLF